MSASLVGSEMCIRDRSSLLRIGAPTRGRALGWPAVEICFRALLFPAGFCRCSRGFRRPQAVACTCGRSWNVPETAWNWLRALETA
eukprot:3006551-Alexandrium_andersonii.AAC.1